MCGGAFQSPDTALVGDSVCIGLGWYLGLTSHIPGPWLLAYQSQFLQGAEGVTEAWRGDKTCQLVAELGTTL